MARRHKKKLETLPLYKKYINLKDDPQAVSFLLKGVLKLLEEGYYWNDKKVILVFNQFPSSFVNPSKSCLKYQNVLVLC